MAQQSASESRLDQSTIEWLLIVAKDPSGWLEGHYAASSELGKLAQTVTSTAAPSSVMGAAPSSVMGAAPSSVMGAAPSSVMGAAPSSVMGAAPSSVMGAAPSSVMA